jgi:hypothetical protein
MCFHLKYVLHSCSFFFIHKVSAPKFLCTYSTLGYIKVFCLIYEHGPYIPDLKWREKPTGNSRINLSTDFCGLPKVHFGELKMCFLPTAPIHMLWYIWYFFNCLEVSKCVFICNMIYIRVPLICFISHHQPNFNQLTRI